jgi:hypothetical protein
MHIKTPIYMNYEILWVQICGGPADSRLVVTVALQKDTQYGLMVHAYSEMTDEITFHVMQAFE